MFYIMHSSGLYFYDKGKIIIFESTDEAGAFLNFFIQYSTNRLMQEGNIGEAMHVPIMVMQQCKILPVDFDVDTIKCGVVYARDLRR